MQRLVEDIRRVVARGPVDREAIAALEDRVREALPRLRQEGLGKEPIQPGRYLCYRDADYGFVVMVLVWGKGDKTPIHDHGIWGVEAVLKNSLKVTNYDESETDPQPLGSLVLSEGAVMHNMPPARDIHRVEHFAGDVAMSLHIYGKEMTGNRSFVPGEGYKCCQLVCKELKLAGFGLDDWSTAGMRTSGTARSL